VGERHNLDARLRRESSDYDERRPAGLHAETLAGRHPHRDATCSKRRPATWRSCFARASNRKESGDVRLDLQRQRRGMETNGNLKLSLAFWTRSAVLFRPSAVLTDPDIKNPDEAGAYGPIEVG